MHTGIVRKVVKSSLHVWSKKTRSSSRQFHLIPTEIPSVPTLDTRNQRRKGRYIVSQLHSTNTMTMPSKDDNIDDIEDFYTKHDDALSRGENTYTDPTTGFMVFTELTHLKRGKCCGNRCRHCPYGYANVKISNKNTSNGNGYRRRRHRIANDDSDTSQKNIPVGKLRSGDKITAQRLVQDIMVRAEEKRRNTTNTSDTTNKVISTHNSRRYDDDDDNDDLSSTVSSNSSSSSRSITSTDTTRKNVTTTWTVEKRNERSIEQKSPIATATDFQSTQISSSVSSTAVPTTKSITTTKNVPYTRSGDHGTSQLGTGERRSKTDDAFEAMGTVDELCSFVGVAHSQMLSTLNFKQQQQQQQQSQNHQPASSASRAITVVDYGDLPDRLLDIMSRLFDVGSHVAKPSQNITGDDNSDHNAIFIPNGIGDGFDSAHVDDLEEWINEMTEDLPELTSFILPTVRYIATNERDCIKSFFLVLFIFRD